jgi:ferredoxin
MPMKILEDCINCAACEDECPNDAISAGDDMYVVDPALCKKCEGEHDSPQCIEVCPIEGCIVDASQPAA